MSAKAESIEFARRAMQRTAAVVHRDMRQGLSSLATVVCLAPLFGLFGTVIGIGNSFPGFAGQVETIRSIVFDRLSQACVPTALGLLVSVPALWLYKYLTGRLECLDLEMENASLELVNLLALRRMHLAPAAGLSLVPSAPAFRDDLGHQLREEPRAGDLSRVAAIAMLIAAWSIHAARYFYQYDALPLEPALRSAAMYVIFSFAVSWFVAYPVWVKIFRRASGGLAALASFICLCWSLAELWWGAHLW